ncbi:iron(III) transport system permease protein [Arthrobacter silviterrae]|uniref:Iron ABC transporter permease n=1 Tax=Arthrobacter silviterrae TaxID=2026658 RepID=A0ABX0DJ60_9MICC|nr:iron ABC transporter permease [Arthrobacter silviterrae]MDQ0278722.1 iron(III) transport system permease protein [Arthrobacter silviterrae]NGN85480.1 iron ABC transporter permease [Arthrobacter silviterrae]
MSFFQSTTAELAPGSKSRRRAAGGRGTRSGPLAVVVLSILIAAFSLLPLGYVVVMTGNAGWDTIQKLVFRPRVGELLFNTLALVLITVPICVVLGIAGAWLVERTRLRGNKAWAVLLAAPLAIPAFVNSYAWVSAIPSLGGVWGGVLVSTLSYFPLVYIPVAAVLSRMDPALEQSGASLGLGPWQVFFRVVLPQLRLAAAGGALLVSLHLLAEYGAFAMMQFDTFTTAIYDQFRSTFNGAAANMLASVLVLFCLLLLLGESKTRGNARYARLGGGAQANPKRLALGWYQVPGQLFLAALSVLALGVPLFHVVRWLIAGGAAIWTGSALVHALLQTLGYGLAGALMTTVLAFPLAYLVIRHPGPVTKVLEGVNYISSSMPGIVVALALVTITVHNVPAVYQTAVVLVAAYALLFMPRALVNLRAGLAQAPKELDEAAQALGKAPLVAFVKVTLRLSAPAAAGGAALVFLGIVNELTATLLLAPNGTTTLATEFWAFSSEIDYAGAAPYALLMILLSAPMTYLLFAQSKKAAGQ